MYFDTILIDGIVISEVLMYSVHAVSPYHQMLYGCVIMGISVDEFWLLVALDGYFFSRCSLIVQINV